MSDLPYICRWDRMGRKGERYAVPVRGTRNDRLVVFADGFRMVTPEGWGKRVEAIVLGDREGRSAIDQMNQIADRMVGKARFPL
jgi:hypothetical protein